MQSETVKGRALPFVLLRANRFRPQAQYPVVIMLHDFGATMYDVVGIASGMDDRGYIYACPNGPYEVKAKWGSGGNAWDMSRENVLPREDGRDAEALFDDFVAEVREQTGVEAGNLLVAGFGQGGEAALNYAVVRPQLFRGAGSLNGPAMDLQALARTVPGQNGQQLFLALASLDEDLLRHGHATRDALVSAGYALKFLEYEAEPAPERDEIERMENEEFEESEEPRIREPRVSIGDFVAWLKETLPPY
jgi:predicted esterase